MYVHLFSAITCGDLDAPTNGIITFASDTTPQYEYQTTATYICSTGYGLSGGTSIRTCEGSTAGPGEWDGLAPSCEGRRIKDFANHCNSG